MTESPGNSPSWPANAAGSGIFRASTPENKPKTLTLNLKELGSLGKGTLITDGDGGSLSFRKEDVKVDAGGTVTVTLKPKGGLVLVFERP